MTTPAPLVERDAHGRPLPPPGIGPTSLKYAMIVPLVAAIVVIGYIVTNLGTGATQSKTTVPSIVKGSGLPVSAGLVPPRSTDRSDSHRPPRRRSSTRSSIDRCQRGAGRSSQPVPRMDDPVLRY